MKIKIKYHLGAIKLKQSGNWIDLFPRFKYEFEAPKHSEKFEIGDLPLDIKFDSKLVDLGISMKLPKYFEANIVPRSSTYFKQGLIQGNHYGIIDGGSKGSKGIEIGEEVHKGYSGEEDIWMFPAIAIRETTIGPDKAICQFRIQPSMNAPWYIKLKWLFTSNIEFAEVDLLNGDNRKGFGHTDKKIKII